jgi:hypothetical protein
MNFKQAFIFGQEGKNKGLPMGEAFKRLSSALNDIQRGKIYTLAGGPKSGKSTVADVAFVIEPAIYVLHHNAHYDELISEIQQQLSVQITPSQRLALNKEYEELVAKKIDFEIIYNSYEIDRVSKEFDFMAHFLHRDYGIYQIPLPEGKTYREKKFVPLSAQYLRGELTYDNNNYDEERETIRVTADIESKIKETYNKRIVPLFGEYDENGVRVSKGLINFVDVKDNPTGVRNWLIRYAEKHGEFVYSTFVKDNVTHKRLIGYKATNPNKFVLIVTDHLRKLLPERGFDLKKTVDKFSEYAVEFRNVCNFSFLHIIHLNRAMSNVDRRSLDEDKLFPTAEDIKETGNLSEDSNYIITMFNPNDDKYNLKSHFGTQIRKNDNTLIYPDMRSLHLVESRHCICPQHFRINMHGDIKKFTPITIQNY